MSLKKVKVKREYKIIIDTREQLPLSFRKGVIKRKLDFGDYACEYDDGETAHICFERKSPEDLAQTITRGHDRFKRELLRACDAGVFLKVIVECSYDDFIAGNYNNRVHSKMRPDVVAKILHKMMVRYTLDVVFTGSRSGSTSFIRNTFNALNEEYYV